MSYFRDLREREAALWERAHDHPCVRGIGDGTLPLEAFHRYVAQDYLFLKDYCRVLALGVAKGLTLETMRPFAELLHATLGSEMDQHRAFAREIGLSEADVLAGEPMPTTYAYTRHLLDSAWHGTQGELLAALLPCQWGYAEIGAQLARQGLPDNPHYARWIATYADPGYQQFAQSFRDLFDRLAEAAGPMEQATMAANFHRSSKYEWQFWQMAWEGEAWD